MRLFTTDEAVIKLVGRSMPLVLLAVVGYSTNTVVSGVLRAANRNEVGLAVNLITLWLVRSHQAGLPSLPSPYSLNHRNALPLRSGCLLLTCCM